MAVPQTNIHGLLVLAALGTGFSAVHGDATLVYDVTASDLETASKSRAARRWNADRLQDRLQACTARSRTSGEYLVDVFIAPSSQEMEPPRKTGRFNPLESR